MAKQVLNGVIVAEVPTLPAAASNVGVLLRQAGKLWYSDGATWSDLSATGGGGGSQEVFVQQTRPSGLGPFTWWQTDTSGAIVDLIVANGVA